MRRQLANAKLLIQFSVQFYYRREACYLKLCQVKSTLNIKKLTESKRMYAGNFVARLTICGTAHDNGKVSMYAGL